LVRYRTEFTNPQHFELGTVADKIGFLEKLEVREEIPMSEVTTDHDRIRKWAEAKGGKPAAVDRTHRDGDVGVIRIMFPKSPHSEHENLVEISWDEFFQEFEERELALIYDEDGLFSKIVGRHTVERRDHGDNQAPGPHITLGARAAGPRDAANPQSKRRNNL
jgi:hypothetical protein